MNQELDADTVARYLSDTPDFFVQQSDLLSQLQLISPVGGRTISLQERQMEVLRDKIRLAERQHAELVRHAQMNAENIRRLLSWSAGLLSSATPANRARQMIDDLKTTFQVEFATFRLWSPVLSSPPGTEAPWYLQPVSADVRLFTDNLKAPYCGINNDFEAARWLAECSQIRSLAMIPLILPQDHPNEAARPHAFGLLILAATEPERYSATMATDLLSEIGIVAAAALAPLLIAGDNAIAA